MSKEIFFKQINTNVMSVISYFVINLWKIHTVFLLKKTPFSVAFFFINMGRSLPLVHQYLN